LGNPEKKSAAVSTDENYRAERHKEGEIVEQPPKTVKGS